MTQKRCVLSHTDIEQIARAIVEKQKGAFYIDEEYHYNAHRRIDRLLDAYERATGLFARTFLALVIVGAIILAGVTAFRGWK